MKLKNCIFKHVFQQTFMKKCAESGKNDGKIPVTQFWRQREGRGRRELTKMKNSTFKHVFQQTYMKKYAESGKNDRKIPITQEQGPEVDEIDNSLHHLTEIMRE